MNPFMEPTVARPLPAGTRLGGQPHPAAGSGNDSAAADRHNACQGNTPSTGRPERRPHRSQRQPLRRTVLFAGLFGLAGLLFPLSASAVDINQADEQELRTLKGIGPKTASNILAERKRGGPYASLIDLSERVRGIGPKKLASLKEAGLVVGPAKKDETAQAKRPAAKK